MERMQGRSSLRASARIVLAAFAASSLAIVPRAQIEPRTLAQMSQRAEGCVAGEITAREVFRVDHPLDGPELYFTRLTIEGRSLYTGAAERVDVVFAGGMLPSGEGVWNSEAPAADDTRVGVEVVAFYGWTDNMGGGVAANALHCAHGGLYRIARTSRGTFVLGRGTGYAVAFNVTLDELGRRVAELRR
jgi:hypothetical protein